MKIASKRKVEIIDYLRGFAALYVVIHHFSFRFGQKVVNLFYRLIKRDVQTNLNVSNG